MTDKRTADDPTVERFDPRKQPDTMMAAEHLARYRWALQFAEGRRVLDAGSGTGFGTLLLAEGGAEHVVGIDNDELAIAQASADRPENVEFAVGDVAVIPFADASFDIVTCMEVIEHVEDADRVLAELHRVLRPNGLLLLSTPNKDVVVPGNPFHLHEFTPDELIETVSRHFVNLTARRQHTWVATSVMDDATLSDGSGSIERVELHRPPGILTGAEPTTLIAASDGEIPGDQVVIEIGEPVELRALDHTFHEQRQLIEDQEHLIKGQQRTIDEQQRTIDDQANQGDELRAEMAALRSALFDAETDLASIPELQSELLELRAIISELESFERQHEQLKVQMDLFLNSTSWRVTSPMRKVMAFCRSKTPGR